MASQLSLKLDPETWDLAYENNNLVWISGSEELAQRITIKLKGILGEWYRDQEFGLPYKEEIRVKNPNLEKIDMIYRAHIMEDEDITRIISLDLNLDKTTRKLKIKCVALSIYGEITIEV